MVEAGHAARPDRFHAAIYAAMPQAACPDTATLTRLLLGQLADEQASAISAHLEGCEACMFALRVLEASNTVAGALEPLGGLAGQSAATGGDPLVRELLPRMRALNAALTFSHETVQCEVDESRVVGDSLTGVDPTTVTRLKVELRIVEGPNTGRCFSFDQHDTFIVGRAKQAHFRLPEDDRYFSRLHLMIEVNPPLCRLVDLNSRNGTFVNDQRVTTTDLRHGDRIRGGKTLIELSLLESREPATVTKSAPPPAPRPTDGESRPQPATRDLVRSTCPLAAEKAVAECPACGAPQPDVARKEKTELCAVCAALSAEQDQLVAGYRIIRELGRGGMGVVYLALREADGSCVALKTIKPAVAGNRRDVDRFLREASILQALDQPNIVGCRDLGDVGGALMYFAMDYVRGTDAARLLMNAGPLEIGRAVRLADQLLAALEYAHAKGYVHRDIKPANLLVSYALPETARLADFGLARVYQASRLSGLTMTGQIGGTMAFIAPEQIADFRNAPPSVDQFAAGATLYYLLTGAHVHETRTDPRKALLAILEGQTVPIATRRADVPADLAAIVHKALARDAKDRFRDVAELRTRLQPFLPGGEVRP